MRDREIVAAIVAGDPAGLAAAYDSYAAVLYSYCRSLLAEPADAGVVQRQSAGTAAGHLVEVAHLHQLLGMETLPAVQALLAPPAHPERIEQSEGGDRPGVVDDQPRRSAVRRHGGWRVVSRPGFLARTLHTATSLRGSSPRFLR